MESTFEKTRAPAKEEASQKKQEAGSARVRFMPNSAMPGANQGGMGREAMRQAMREKMIGIFGPTYVNLHAEAEADRIGSRYSGAKSVDDLKERMGTDLGADFSDIHFHTGAEAAARAPTAEDSFSAGRDIYMGGSFNPVIAAHEMVHTVQTGATPATAPVVSAPAGAVQAFNPFKWLWKKIKNGVVGAYNSIKKSHHKALDQYHNNRETYNQMGKMARLKWVLMNPIAALRRNTKGAMNDTIGRNLDRKREDALAGKLSSMWKDGELGDAAGMELPKPMTLKNMMEDQPGPVGPATRPQDEADMPRELNEGMSLPIPILGDASSLKANLKNQDMLEREGNKGGMRKARAYAAADALNLGTSGYGYLGMVTSLPAAGVVSSAGAAASNAIKMGTDIASAIGNGISQHKLRKQSEYLATDVQKKGLLDKDPAALSDKERYEITRMRTATQAKRAASVRKSEDINNAVSNAIKMTGNIAAAGVKGAGVTLPFIGDKLGTLVGLGGSILGAISNKIGGIFTGRKKKNMRRNTVNEELGIKDKISALRGGNEEYLERLGISKEQAQNMSKSEAKHIILKSMGFKSGKYKEAFSQITKNRARALTERANSGDDNDEEVQMMKNMFLSKVDLGDGKMGYSTAGVARKLGYERYYDNPFQKEAEQEQEDKKNGKKWWHFWK